MAEALAITPSAVSQHLKVLRHAGLVRNERKGYTLPYEIDHTAMAQCKEVITEVCNCGCKGSCRAEDRNVDDSEDDLASLMKRERELQEELQALRAKIKERKRKQ
jgi:DNA-binding transcriptional ArsR family regulator